MLTLYQTKVQKLKINMELVTSNGWVIFLMCVSNTRNDHKVPVVLIILSNVKYSS